MRAKYAGLIRLGIELAREGCGLDYFHADPLTIDAYIRTNARAEEAEMRRLLNTPEWWRTR